MRQFGRRLRRHSRVAVLGLVLAGAVFVVPDATVRTPDSMLVRVDTARGIGHSKDVIWILCLGSDARPGQNPLATRADAIQLVGLNLKTGAATGIGIPRDSWVPIDGVGSNRVNAALYFGGPELMAKTVGDLVGVHPDYVFVTTFTGFRAMVQNIGGLVVNSDMAFTDDNIPAEFHEGKNHVNGFQALAFGRMRHYLPRGDFDRSAHQQELLKAMLRKARANEDKPGFMERGMLSVLRNLHTDLSPAELYKLAQAVTDVDPKRFTTCVLDGSIGNIGGASVVLPDTGQARRLGDEARDDATLDGSCHS